MKKFLLATAIIATMVSSFGCGSDTPTPKPGTNTAITAEANSPEGEIQKSIVNFIDKSSLATSVIRLNKIEINKLDNGYNVNVWAKLDGETWSESTALSAIRLYAIPVYAGAFTSKQPVVRVSFLVQADMTDGKGNTHLAKVFQSDLTQKEAQSYNWENSDAIDPDKLGSHVFIHRAFRK